MRILFSHHAPALARRAFQCLQKHNISGICCPFGTPVWPILQLPCPDAPNRETFLAQPVSIFGLLTSTFHTCPYLHRTSGKHTSFPSTTPLNPGNGRLFGPLCVRDLKHWYYSGPSRFPFPIRLIAKNHKCPDPRTCPPPLRPRTSAFPCPLIRAMSPYAILILITYPRFPHPNAISAEHFSPNLTVLLTPSCNS